MGKPRRKEVITPDLMENLRFRYEETAESMVDIARSVRHSHTWLRALAGEQSWTRFKPPPLDLTPAARLAAEVGRLAAEAGRPPAEAGRPAAEAGKLNVSRHPEVPSRSDGLEGSVSQRPFEARLRRAPQGDGADEAPPPTTTTDPAPPLAAPTGGGEQAPDLSNLAPDARMTRLSEFARGIDHQLALLRQRQALPQREHEMKEINAQLNDLLAGQGLIEHRLAELKLGRSIPMMSNNDDDIPDDIDAFRLDLARRIREFVRSRSGGGDAAGDRPAGTVDESV